MKPCACVVTRMIPGTIGVAAFQINVALVQSLAFWVGPHIVASFNYAVRLMELPQGMFGISLATYLLPTLSALAPEKNYPEFRTTLRHGIGYAVFCQPDRRHFAGRAGRADRAAAVRARRQIQRRLDARASLALMCLAPGLVAFSTVNILARAFYALGDTKTPMKISLAASR